MSDQSTNAEFNNRRLVAVYDAECPWSRDDDYFVAKVGTSALLRVLDFGCGTGRLALGLAAIGHTVTGVDPARASLDTARAKPSADSVSWVEGDAHVLPHAAFDIALMTSHVAQFLIGDEEWLTVLTRLRQSLVDGGKLLFDARDPQARAWDKWNSQDSRRAVTMLDGARVDIWTQVQSLKESVVTFTHHYRFGDGSKVESTSSLRFRTEVEIRDTLSTAGFSTIDIRGGWMDQAVGSGDGEFLVSASAT